jgi:hypothetical protein
VRLDGRAVVAVQVRPGRLVRDAAQRAVDVDEVGLRVARRMEEQAGPHLPGAGQVGAVGQRGKRLRLDPAGIEGELVKDVQARDPALLAIGD